MEVKSVIITKQWGYLLIVLISLLCRISKVDAASTGQEYSLRGLEGVMVVVEILPNLKTDGLTRKQIYSDVEKQLQKAGIRVFLEKEWQTIEGRPYLHIEIIGTKIQDNWKFYTSLSMFSSFKTFIWLDKPEAGRFKHLPGSVTILVTVI